ncbi:hypothetical protein AB4Y89_07585 [Terriglobus sp. 2YAB30_2]|uniref:hypothetical protein n=1 Tax=unclassified Terriglobus TaxID=2628988 RepID=UPI003F95B02F
METASGGQKSFFISRRSDFDLAVKFTTLDTVEHCRDSTAEWSSVDVNMPGASTDGLAESKTIRNSIESTVDLEGAHI